jgi:tripartite-type tricarboxylate transporter receptor subunit TctC
MKKVFVTCLGVFLMLCVVNENGRVQAAEKYPVKPITLIMPLEAGGGLDVAIRPFCEHIGKLLGQPVIVVNKPGAGSSIGYRAIHDAKPDGYTIGAAMLTLVANKLQGILPYDHADFTILGTNQMPTPVIVASTKSKRQFKTFKEVIEFAKAHPEDILVAAGGKGQGWWNAAKDIEGITGVRFNLVPQVGSGASSIAQVAGGHVELGIVSLAEAKTQIEAGNAILLVTVVPGNRRIPSYPDVPCITEFGYNMRYASIAFILGPPNMPKEITDKLIKVVEIGAKDPEYAKFLADKIAAVSLYWTPEETIKQLDQQRELLRDIFTKAGVIK